MLDTYNYINVTKYIRIYTKSVLKYILVYNIHIFVTRM